MTENQIETPVVAGFEAALGALRRAPYGGADGDPAVGAGAGAGRVLGEWEGLVRRIEAGRRWTEAEFRAGLAARDRIPEYAHGLATPVAALFREALGEVDGVFVTLTVEDEGWLAGEPAHGWWWHRRPRR
jgi:hypothetical protein